MNTLLTKEVLTEIDNILRKPPATLLRARMVAAIKQAKNPYKDTFRFFWYTPSGSAELYQMGQFASNVPLVGDKGGYVDHPAFMVANAFPMSESELALVAEGASRGLVPDLDVQANRIADSRDYCYRTENRTFFIGNPALGMKGLLNFSQTIMVDGESKTYAIKSENTADGDNAETGVVKKYWKKKKPAEIVKDIVKGRNHVLSQKTPDGEPLFNPNTLLIPDHLSSIFLMPYNENLPSFTLLDWLRGQKIFENIMFLPELGKKYSGLGSDCFVIMDNRPEVVQLGLFYEPTVFHEERQSDGVGNYKYPVRAKTAGCLLYHPSAVYRGDQIGDGEP